jgi:hypothetical protein
LVDVVVKVGRFSTEVLPVVSVVALGFIMLLVERTPFCLEEEHIEVEVFLHEVNDSRLDIPDGVSKGTVVSIFAINQVFGELGAELGFVLLNMIEPFNSVMRQITQFLLFASIGLSMVAHV